MDHRPAASGTGDGAAEDKPHAPMYAVLMAGGSGTRFWPASREARPKQLISLTGGPTLLKETYLRVCPVVGEDNVLVVTARPHAAAVAEELSDLRPENILTEPVARNTAACAALAAAEVYSRHPDGVIALFPADHVIHDVATWRRLIRGSWRLAAEEDRVITFGLEPDRPETGFGYLQLGNEIASTWLPGLRSVAAFVEKPNLERAKELLADRNHLWNSGVFVMRAAHLLELVRTHLPEFIPGLRSLDAARDKPEYAAVLEEVYGNFPAISLDKGIMEKATGLVVAPARVGWSDVGSWSALEDVLPVDASGNATSGPALCLDSTGCVVYSSGSLVSVLGLTDVVVVQTPDAILVCPKDRAQDVRLVVERLRKEKLDRLL